MSCLPFGLLGSKVKMSSNLPIKSQYVPLVKTYRCSVTVIRKYQRSNTHWISLRESTLNLLPGNKIFNIKANFWPLTFLSSTKKQYLFLKPYFLWFFMIWYHKIPGIYWYYFQPQTLKDDPLAFLFWCKLSKFPSLNWIFPGLFSMPFCVPKGNALCKNTFACSYGHSW